MVLYLYMTVMTVMTVGFCFDYRLLSPLLFITPLGLGLAWFQLTLTHITSVDSEQSSLTHMSELVIIAQVFG